MGCQIEGHHLSLSFTVDSGRIISATPNVFASNPAEIMAGKRKGERPLGETIDQYRAMLAALTKEQQTIAKQPKLFPEIKENESKPSVGAPVGLSADEMTEAQQTVLWKLIEAYAGRMPTDVATAEMNRIEEAGISKVTFAYGGGDAAVAGIPSQLSHSGTNFPH
jgi:hypothetical protein